MSVAVVDNAAAAVPDSLAGWHACAADLRSRQTEQEAERAHLATRRQMLALAAATGDGRAQKKIEQLVAREQILAVNAVSLNQALERATAEIAAQEATILAEGRTKAIAALDARLAARLVLVAEIEQRLSEIVPLLTSLGRETHAVTAGHLALGASRTSLPPLATEAIGGRLAEFMAGIGFADWLPLARPEIRPALDSWIDAERTAQMSYVIAA